MKGMRKYMGAMALGTALMAVTGCSDTWDDHYQGGQGTSATQSLWELIKADPNLTQFAELARKVQYHRDETHPQANYTFEKMLSGTQLLTVWAPQNSALTDAQWQQWKTLAETSPYTVQQQILANSISLWHQVATGGGVDTLTLLNGKKQAFDKNRFTMASLPLQGKNLAATNGTLHTLASVIPFDYNLYEYVKDKANAQTQSLTTLHNQVIASDTTYFSEQLSIEGNPDADGNPTYVDSVYLTTNTMFLANKRFPSDSNTEKYLTYDESFGASIETEDSTFVMVMPTDKAWQAAYNKLEGYYKYADVYLDNTKANSGTKNAVRTVSNPDSLKQKCINMDILSPLCLNLHFQPDASGTIGRWQLDDFMKNYSKASYLLNTYADTLRTDSVWNKASFLEGRQVKMSNGYGIVTDTWNVPAKLYKPDLSVEIGYRSFYNLAEKKGNINYYTFYQADWVDTVGHVSKGNFYQIAPSSPSEVPKVEFRLVGTDGENFESEVMSGKYDIYLVMVPDFYTTSTDIISGDTLKHNIRATLSYNNNDPKGKDATKQVAKVVYNGLKVDSLLLFEDFEFPYSYKNLIHSYPTLSIECRSTQAERKEGFSNSFCIDRIILKSKD